MSSSNDSPPTIPPILKELPTLPTQTEIPSPVAPLRDYIERSPLPPPILPPVYAPNSSIPNSLRTLASLFFLVGATATTLTWLYRTIIYPRLIRSLISITKLKNIELISQTKLLESIKNLTKVNYFKHKKIVEIEGVNVEGDNTLAVPMEDIKKAVEGEQEKVEEVKVVAEEVSTPILEGLRTSLQELTSVITTIPSFSIVPLSSTSISSPSPNATSSLSTSLTTFNDYIASERQASYSASYRSYGLASAPTSLSIGDKPKTVAEAVSGLKTEIRVVKGALLNRRNFPATQRVDVV